jgi:hypothetical protein
MTYDVCGGRTEGRSYYTSVRTEFRYAYIVYVIHFTVKLPLKMLCIGYLNANGFGIVSSAIPIHFLLSNWSQYADDTLDDDLANRCQRDDNLDRL